MRYVYSSPFRRCLQTAGAVARAAGLSSVTVHLGLGEETCSVSEELAVKGLSTEGVADGSGDLYLSIAAQDEALGDGVAHVNGGTPHPFDATFEDALDRIAAAIGEIAARHPKGGVVMVSHGFAFQAIGSRLLKPAVALKYRDYCGYAVFDGSLTLLATHGVTRL